MVTRGAMWSQSDDSKIDVLPTSSYHLSNQDEGRRGKSWILKLEKKIRAYITLEMCLLTQSDIEVQLTIKLNAVLDKLTML